MTKGSVISLGRADLMKINSNKNIEDLSGSDFIAEVRDELNTAHVVIFNDWGKSKILKNRYGHVGEIV